MLVFSVIGFCNVLLFGYTVFYVFNCNLVKSLRGKTEIYNINLASSGGFIQQSGAPAL